MSINPFKAIQFDTENIVDDLSPEEELSSFYEEQEEEFEEMSETNVDLTRLQDSYKILHIEHYPVTKKEVREAYKSAQDKVTDSEFAHLTLLQYSSAMSYIITYLDVDPFNIRSTVPIDDFEYYENNEVFNLSYEAELISWEEALRNIDDVEIKSNLLYAKDHSHKKKRRQLKKKPKPVNKKKRIALLIVGAVLLIIAIANIINVIRINQIKEKPDEEILEALLPSEKIKLFTQEFSISKKDKIMDYDIKKTIYIPFLEIVIYQADYAVNKSNNLFFEIHELSAYSYEIKESKDGTKRLELKNEIASISDIDNAELNLSGTWKGMMKLTEESSLIYEVEINVKEPIQGHYYQGTCKLTSENKKAGVYEVDIEVDDDNLNIDIIGTDWIEHPTFFNMIDFNGRYFIEDEGILPRDKDGAIYKLGKAG